MFVVMKKERMHQMYSGLEMLKNGFIYDKRYNGKKLRISRPTILVFGNSLPIKGLIAPDRWKIWYLTPGKCLRPYDEAQHPLWQPAGDSDAYIWYLYLQSPTHSHRRTWNGD